MSFFYYLWKVYCQILCNHSSLRNPHNAGFSYAKLFYNSG